MVAQVSIKVLPGFPEVPTSIEIRYSGVDSERILEFLIDEKIKASIPVNSTSNYQYIVQESEVSYLLAFGHTEQKVDVFDICAMFVDNHSLMLRYKD